MKRVLGIIIVFLNIIMLVLVAQTVSAQTVTDLGTLPDGNTFSIAYGINDRGQVVGQSQAGLYIRNATLWNVSTVPITVTDLGTLSGGYIGSHANSINNLGQAVGQNFGNTFNATLLDTLTGTTTDLGKLPGGGTSDATGINDLGQVSGWTSFSKYVWNATLWNTSTVPITVIDLGTLSPVPVPSSKANSINNLGQAVGWSYNATGYAHAVIWNTSTRVITDLGTLPGGTTSIAYGINNLGQVVGKIDNHAVIWNTSTVPITVTDLGTLGGTTSVAIGINDLGQVVGWSFNAAGYAHAVIWNSSTVPITVTDLGTLPGGTTSIAYGINNLGQVVGQSSDATGNLHATLWNLPLLEDTTPPAIVCGSADGNWHGSDVNIECTASDSGSGLANSADASFSLNTMVSDGTETDNAATAIKSVCDAAGNCAIAGPIGGNKIDKKAPAITISAPNVGPYTLNQLVEASYSCNDGGSGVAICSGTVASGSNIDTSTVGSKTLSVTSTDIVGNSATSTITYTITYEVAYNWNGFFQPVDNLPTLNAVKVGSAVPVKFSLGGNQGLNIFVQGYPVSKQIACLSGEPIDDIEQTATASQSSLSYDATTGQYNYIWMTEKDYPVSSCRQLDLKLIDGTTHSAQFKFK